MVISFSEEFGKDKMKNYKDALELIKHELPAFIKETRLQYDNIIWFAGLHENTDNRHIHLSFFEDKPLRIVSNKENERFNHHGKLSNMSFENFKVHIEQRLTSKEYELSNYRRRLMDDTTDALNTLSGYAVYSKEFTMRLLEIYRLLPKGKFGYNNKELDAARPLIKDMINFILNSNPDMKDEFFSLVTSLIKKDEDTKAICKRSGIDDERFLITDKFVDDFYRRCGNKIIDFAKKYKEEDYQFRRIPVICQDRK